MHLCDFFLSSLLVNIFFSFSTMEKFGFKVKRIELELEVVVVVLVVGRDGGGGGESCVDLRKKSSFLVHDDHPLSKAPKNDVAR